MAVDDEVKGDGTDDSSENRALEAAMQEATATAQRILAPFTASVDTLLAVDDIDQGLKDRLRLALADFTAATAPRVVKILDNKPDTTERVTAVFGELVFDITEQTGSALAEVLFEIDETTRQRQQIMEAMIAYSDVCQALAPNLKQATGPDITASFATSAFFAKLVRRMGHNEETLPRIGAPMPSDEEKNMQVCALLFPAYLVGMAEEMYAHMVKGKPLKVMAEVLLEVTASREAFAEANPRGFDESQWIIAQTRRPYAKAILRHAGEDGKDAVLIKGFSESVLVNKLISEVGEARMRDGRDVVEDILINDAAKPFANLEQFAHVVKSLGGDPEFLTAKNGTPTPNSELEIQALAVNLPAFCMELLPIDSAHPKYDAMTRLQMEVTANRETFQSLVSFPVTDEKWAFLLEHRARVKGMLNIVDEVPSRVEEQFALDAAAATPEPVVRSIGHDAGGFYDAASGKPTGPDGE